jgi:hypothetical protein
MMEKRLSLGVAAAYCNLSHRAVITNQDSMRIVFASEKGVSNVRDDRGLYSRDDYMSRL